MQANLKVTDVKCPHCKHWQVINMDFRDDGEPYLDYTAAEITSCIKCAKQITVKVKYSVQVDE